VVPDHRRALIVKPNVEDKCMRLIETVEEKTEALCVRDIAQVLRVSKQQVYKMAAKGEIPSFRVFNPKTRSRGPTRAR
jgi:hypothetical protein